MRAILLFVTLIISSPALSQKDEIWEEVIETWECYTNISKTGDPAVKLLVIKMRPAAIWSKEMGWVYIAGKEYLTPYHTHELRRSWGWPANEENPYDGVYLFTIEPDKTGHYSHANLLKNEPAKHIQDFWCEGG